MKIRTCPHCNYKYSVAEYFKKLLFRLAWAKWDCSNCGNRITFNFNRRIIVAICFGAFTIVLSLAANEIVMTLGMWIGLAAIYILGSAFIFTFDTFKKAEESIEKSNSQSYTIP